MCCSLTPDTEHSFHPFWLSGKLVVFLYRCRKFAITPKRETHFYFFGFARSVPF
jgi:hypothetical protein